MPGVNFTDQFFAKTISALSVNDSLFFTPQQFYYFFNLRRNTKSADQLAGCGWILLVLAFIVLGVVFASQATPLLYSLPILMLLTGTLLLIPGVRKRLSAKKMHRLRIDAGQLESWSGQWMQINGPMTKMLPPPTLNLPAAQVNPDVTVYSFDRVVVCDSASVAQFLIANNFHFENNCAVLGVGGYPQAVFDTVMEMLRRNPELKVYALHDASPSGVALAHRLRTDPAWFKENTGVTIYDLGLLPRQTFARTVFVQESEKSKQMFAKFTADAVRSGLQPEEVKWFAEGKYVELESVPPQVLLRMVTLGIAKSRDPRSSDALIPVDSGGGSGGGDGGVYIFASDSFG